MTRKLTSWLLTWPPAWYNAAHSSQAHAESPSATTTRIVDQRTHAGGVPYRSGGRAGTRTEEDEVSTASGVVSGGKGSRAPLSLAGGASRNERGGEIGSG